MRSTLVYFFFRRGEPKSTTKKVVHPWLRWYVFTKKTLDLFDFVLWKRCWCKVLVRFCGNSIFRRFLESVSFKCLWLSPGWNLKFFISFRHAPSSDSYNHDQRISCKISGSWRLHSVVSASTEIVATLAIIEESEWMSVLMV